MRLFALLIVAFSCASSCNIVFEDEDNESAPRADLPWSGNVELGQQGNFLTVALDSDLDEKGLDGKTDALILAALSSTEPLHLPERLDSVQVVLDMQAGSVEILKEERLFLRVGVGGNLTEEKELKKGEKNPSTGTQPESISAQGIFYSLAARNESLHEASQKWLQEVDARFVDTPRTECNAGGEGARAASLLANGVICARGYYACCGTGSPSCQCLSQESFR